MPPWKNVNNKDIFKIEPIKNNMEVLKIATAGSVDDTNLHHVDHLLHRDWSN